MATANIKPPTYKKTNLCPYCAVVSESLRTPNKGNKMMGINAVTAIGTTSKIHHIAIQIVIPSSINALGFRPSGGSIVRKMINTKGPNIFDANDFNFCKF